MYPYYYPSYVMTPFSMCHYCAMNRDCSNYQAFIYQEESMRYLDEFEEYNDYNEENYLLDEPELEYMYRQRPSAKKNITLEEASEVAERLGIDFESSPFDLEQFRTGMEVELEHGLRNPATNVTGDDLLLTGKIALAHLNEFPDYYVRLKKLEDEAKQYWGVMEV